MVSFVLVVGKWTTVCNCRSLREANEAKIETMSSKKNYRGAEGETTVGEKQQVQRRTRHTEPESDRRKESLLFQPTNALWNAKHTHHRQFATMDVLLSKGDIISSLCVSSTLALLVHLFLFIFFFCKMHARLLLFGR